MIILKGYLLESYYQKYQYKSYRSKKYPLDYIESSDQHNRDHVWNQGERLQMDMQGEMVSGQPRWGSGDRWPLG